jgi:mono/diheme cytochrome c family protein
MKYVLIGIAMMVFLVVSLAGFRGDISRKPPLEVFPDMDRQPKLRPMEPNGFFKNGMSSQPLVEGTVARSEAIDLGNGKKAYPFEKGHAVVSGFASGTNTVASIPIPVTSQLMLRGRAKYNISCLPCHGGQGDGNGVVKHFGFSAIKDLHDPNVVKLNDGQLYRVVTVGNLEGKGLMKGYASTLDVTDRWAIVAYVRALQLSRLGKEGEVPEQFHVKAKSADKKPVEEEKH